MLNVYADLHVHTTHSDGALELSEVPMAAHDAGISVVAITDHDAIHPDLDDVIVEKGEITIIRGIELRVEVPELGERVDLLGYGVERTPELMDELKRLQNDRETRSQRIINRVEEELGISLGIEGQEGMGRPHIARAIDNHEGTDYDYNQAFEEVIGHDCPAYVSRDVTEFETGVRLLSEACSVVSLAHPFRYSDSTSAIALTEHLDAIEGPYPYGEENQSPPLMASNPVMEAAEAYDLLLSGGSDAHDTTLGIAGLSKSDFEPLANALGLK